MKKIQIYSHFCLSKISGKLVWLFVAFCYYYHHRYYYYYNDDDDDDAVLTPKIQGLTF